MSILDIFKRGNLPTLTLPNVKREEIRLCVRENQTLTKLEKLEKEKEEIFSRGTKIKSPSRRRQLARLYEMKAGGVKMLERELTLISKELTTLSAVKLMLERRAMAKDGIQRLLHRLDESELAALLENDKIGTEMYVEKLNSLLSTVTEDAQTLAQEIGQEGQDVMKVWERMDEGEIQSFEDGLKMADKIVKERSRKEMETE